MIQPELHAPEWPELKFYGKAQTDNTGVYWWEELMEDGSIIRHPLQPYNYSIEVVK